MNQITKILIQDINSGKENFVSQRNCQQNESITKNLIPQKTEIQMVWFL